MGKGVVLLWLSAAAMRMALLLFPSSSYSSSRISAPSSPSTHTRSSSSSSSSSSSPLSCSTLGMSCLWAELQSPSPSYLTEELSSRPEIVTALTSTSSVKEGIFLWERGASPYEGDILHAPPLLLLLLYPIEGSSGTRLLRALFWTMIQVLVAVIMRMVVVEYERSPEVSKDCCHLGLALGDEDEEDDIPKLIEEENKKHQVQLDAAWINELVPLAYMLHPYSILTCIGTSTISVDHLFVMASVLCALRGRTIQTSVAISTATYISPYYIVLLPPLALLLRRKQEGAFSSYFSFVGACCAVMGALMYTSYAIMGSWDFVNAVYYFTFTVPDLSPNVGLFWYFFIEIFDQFRNFFLFLFQYHMLVYPIPLAMRVSHRPLFLFAFSLGYIAIFKSYPSIGDAAFYMPLLIIFHRQLIEMRNLFILVQILLFVTVLSPIFWHLWIVTGAGNSNFYYGLTLAYSAAQVLIISESMLAVLKQDKKQRLLSKKRD